MALREGCVRADQKQMLLSLPPELVNEVAVQLLRPRRVFDACGVVMMSRTCRELCVALRWHCLRAHKLFVEGGYAKVRWRLPGFDREMRGPATRRIFSPHFSTPFGHVWRILIYPQHDGFVSLFLDVENYPELSADWCRTTMFSFQVGPHTVDCEKQFDAAVVDWGWREHLSHEFVRAHCLDGGELTIKCELHTARPTPRRFFAMVRHLGQVKDRYFETVAKHKATMLAAVGARVAGGWKCPRCGHRFALCTTTGSVTCSSDPKCVRSLLQLFAWADQQGAASFGLLTSTGEVRFHTPEVLPEDF